MRLGLSEAEQAAYRQDGFFVREAAFSASELVRLRAAAERVAERAALAGREATSYWIDGNRYVEAAEATLQFEHRPGSQTLRVVEPFHHLDPELEGLIDDPRLVEPMRDLLGCRRLSLFTDKLNFKRPREGSRFRWHQDSPYWITAGVDLGRLPNVLLYLDAASQANGCLRFVRGSHRRGMLPGLREGTLGPLFTDPAHLDLSSVVAVEAPAGSLIFFSPHLVHGSEPNRSEQPRRALVLTYQPGVRRMFKRDALREAGAPAPQPEGSSPPPASVRT